MNDSGEGGTCQVMRHPWRATLLLCCALLLCLSGCARQPAERGRPASIKIGVALYDQYDTFIGELTEVFVEEARQKEEETGIKIMVLREGAGGSQEAQNRQVEDFIKSGCDVLCVNLVDRMDAAMVIDRVEAAQIPVIFFNRELVEADLQRSDMLYYVGADAAESGQMQGEVLAEICGLTQADPFAMDVERFAEVDRNGDGVIQYVMLEGEAGHQDAVVRTERSIKAVTDAGFQMERLGAEIANWVRSQAETRMQAWLREHGPAIEVVFANNDDMALGAIDALKRADVPRADWPVILGIDGTSVGVKAVFAGEMAATVYNDFRGQAKSMLTLAYALAMGETLPPLTDGKYIRLPYQVITPRNVEDFLIE